MCFVYIIYKYVSCIRCFCSKTKFHLRDIEVYPPKEEKKGKKKTEKKILTKKIDAGYTDRAAALRGMAPSLRPVPLQNERSQET